MGTSKECPALLMISLPLTLPLTLPLPLSLTSKECPAFLMISGARYSGVPHSVYVRPSLTILAKPKSTTRR